MYEMLLVVAISRFLGGFFIRKKFLKHVDSVKETSGSVETSGAVLRSASVK